MYFIGVTLIFIMLAKVKIKDQNEMILWQNGLKYSKSRRFGLHFFLVTLFTEFAKVN